MKLSCPGYSFVGFLVFFSPTDWILLLVIGLMIFAVFSWFKLGRLYISRIFVHFFSVIHFISILFFVVISYDPLYFCVVCCNFFFISDFIDLHYLFFLMTVLKVYWFYLFEEQALNSIDLFDYIFDSISFISVLCYDFFPSTNFGFVSVELNH